MRFVCESLDDIALCFVNLRSTKTLFECANLILSELGAEALPSAKGLGAVVLAIKDAIASYLQDAKKHVIILALDEFDMIFYDKRNKPSDFMYKLVVLCEQLKKEKNYQLCIVGISNNVVSEYDLDERVRSRIGNSEVFFPAYGYEEILEILRMCSKEAFNEMDVAKKNSKTYQQSILSQIIEISHIRASHFGLWNHKHHTSRLCSIRNTSSKDRH